MHLAGPRGEAPGSVGEAETVRHSAGRSLCCGFVGGVGGGAGQPSQRGAGQLQRLRWAPGCGVVSGCPAPGLI